MKNRHIIAGNWKMNKSNKEANSFIIEIQNRILDNGNTDVIFCPPFTSLITIVEALKNSQFYVGAQNVHYEIEGAYTGEISVNMLTSIGVEYVIVGHSERRHIFGESDDFINKKIVAVKDSKLIPIFCIGETLEQRNSGLTGKILNDQIEFGLKNIENIDPDNFIIAYEPVWAIGTGETASVLQVEEAHHKIKTYLKNLFGSNGEQVPILYGGSVNEKNAESLINTGGVNGFLIGGSSLKIDSFSEIINIVNNF
mgnify:FL=1